MTRPSSTDSTENVARRVEQARDLQKERYAKLSPDDSIRTNAQAEGKVLEEVAQLSSDSVTMMKKAIDQFRLSARGYHRVLKVARTLADLEGSDQIMRVHVAEALSYRQAMSF